MGATFWPDFLRRYLRRSPPRYLLLGIQPRDVDRLGILTISRPTEQRFWSSEAVINRDISPINSAAEEALADASILWGRHGSFFPAASGVLRHRTRYDPEDVTVDNAQGWSRFLPSFQQTPATLERGLRAAQRRGESLRFSLDPAAARSIAYLARLTHERGGRLILFTLPTFYDSEVWGTPAVHRDFLAAMRALARRLPSAAMLDLGDRFGPDYSVTDYGDENHLNGPAAERFSAQLADAVVPLLAPTR
jgi:hypothetical protein